MSNCCSSFFSLCSRSKTEQPVKSSVIPEKSRSDKVSLEFNGNLIGNFFGGLDLKNKYISGKKLGISYELDYQNLSRLIKKLKRNLKCLVLFLYFQHAGALVGVFS
jgi:hypothetical protein